MIAIIILTFWGLAAALAIATLVSIVRRQKRENDIQMRACKNFRNKKYVKGYVKRKGWKNS